MVDLVADPAVVPHRQSTRCSDGSVTAENAEAAANGTEAPRATQVGFRVRPETPRIYWTFAPLGPRAALPAALPAPGAHGDARSPSAKPPALIGCSAWTVRQTLMPLGFRTSGSRQRQVDLLHEPNHSLDSKTSRKEDLREPVQARQRLVGVSLPGRCPSPILHRDFQPQAGRENRSQAQRGSQQSTFPDRRIRSRHDDSANSPPGSSRAAPSGPHHLYHLKFLLPFFSDFPVLRITQISRRGISEGTACGEPGDQGRDDQPRFERPPAYSLLGSRRAAPRCESAGPNENGAGAAHPPPDPESSPRKHCSSASQRVTSAP